MLRHQPNKLKLAILTFVQEVGGSSPAKPPLFYSYLR